RQVVRTFRSKEIEHRLRRRQQQLVTAADRVPLADDRKTADVEDDEAAFGKFAGNRVGGDEGDAEARHNRLLDRLLAAPLPADDRLQIRFLEYALHQRA